MKILHAHKYFYLRGGAERYMLELIKLQEEAGHTVAPFAMHYPKNDPSPWSEFFVSEINTESGAGRGVDAVRQFGRALWSHEAYKQMLGMIEAFRPEICHVHNIYTHISPSILKACGRRNIPVVMSVHDYALVSANHALWAGTEPMDLNHLGVLATAKTKYIKDSYTATFTLSCIQKWHHLRHSYDRYIDKYLVASIFLKDILVKNGFNENKICVLPLFAQPSLSLAQKEDGSVVYFGRLERYKGVHNLIEAMKLFPQVTLKIIGSGPYESELRKIAKGMGNVKFLGFVSGNGLWETVGRARVVVVPSQVYETFGLSALEAMAVGRPVIVSDVGALKEVVEDGVSGRVFRAGDVHDLANKLNEFIHDVNYSNSMGEASLQRAEVIGNAERHLVEVMQIYADISNLD
ncbi:MAG: glycosyltransferase [Candidatus Uhrbacteria bacterium]|nr:glycosyltransferase [Candidatus Uhrbacteria bacterium]